MPQNNGIARTIADYVGVQMTPVQINDVIESNLVHLKLEFENVYREMVRLKDDLANGEFDMQNSLRRARKKLQFA